MSVFNASQYFMRVIVQKINIFYEDIFV